jgi:hypothetical protein
VIVLPLFVVVAVKAEYAPHPATAPITPTTRRDRRSLRVRFAIVLDLLEIAAVLRSEGLFGAKRGRSDSPKG